jgi:chorismate mutase/prephenate dehydratase
MSACRALETPTRVAYLGPAGTFSEEAALGYFGSSIVRVPCASIDEVFRVTSRRRRRLRRGAGGEQHRRAAWHARSTCSCHAAVHHRRDQPVRAPQPAAQGRTLDGIEGRVRAPAGAGAVPRLAQPAPARAERRPVASNAEGARLAALDPALAAIASDRAAASTACTWWPRHPGRPHNRTRFAIVTHPESTRTQAPGARLHQPGGVGAEPPGAVHDMLVPLKTHGVSMTRFESRPARSGQWEYYFYIDIDGHPDEPHVAAALKELRSACAFFKVLGTYPIDVH